PHLPNVPLRMIPVELAALWLAVDAGVALGQQNFRTPIAIDVADREDGRDIAAGELMLLPLVILAQILVPVRPGDDLVLAVAVQIGDGEALFRLVSLTHVGGDHLDAGPGTEARVLRQRRPVERSAALVPEQQRSATVAGDVADQFIMELIVS